MVEKEENIDILSSEANEIMAENKYYYKKLSFYDKYIDLTRKVITNLLSIKDIGKAIECFNKYIDEIQKDYDDLNKAYENKELPEYNELMDNLFSEITMGRPILKQKRNTKFYLDNSKMEKDFIIKGLKESIKQSKQFQLFREPKRFTLIGVKEGSKEIEKTTTELQQNMLYELKKCNKFKERAIKYNKQIEIIKDNIDILKNVQKKDTISSNSIGENNENEINDEENIIESKLKPEFNIEKMDIKKSYNIMPFNKFRYKSYNKNFQEDNESEGGSEDRKKIRKEREKRENEIISGFKKVEDLFEMSDVGSDKENLIDDDLNSDDEGVFGNKIKQPIKLTEYFLDDVKKEIPEINLDQIEYNKMKVIKEDDLYSIQRRKYKNQNIDNKMKDLKKDIEEMEQKLELLKKKEKVMKEYIDKFKKNYSELRNFNRRNTSVHNQKTKLIKRSLMFVGGENIREESSDENNDNEVASDYSNEEVEIQDFAKGKQSVNIGVENYGKQNLKSLGGFGGALGKSVRDDIFKNKLRNRLKMQRAKSK